MNIDCILGIDATTSTTLHARAELPPFSTYATSLLDTAPGEVESRKMFHDTKRGQIKAIYSLEWVTRL